MTSNNDFIQELEENLIKEVGKKQYQELMDQAQKEYDEKKSKKD